MLTSRPAPLTASRPLHVKTPGRALQKARGILQENALHGPRTAKTHKARLQTPLEGGSKEAQSSKVNLVTRPLGDKTPFANRQRRAIQDPTPGPAKGNPPVQTAKLELLIPGHALLSSSVRRTVRGRHSSGPVFETPVTNGNHWDVMEGDIAVPAAPEAQGEEARPEDYDEIEYMAPTAIEPPFTPHFDMPDFKLVGAQLFDMMHSFHRDDATDRFYAAEKENIDDTGLLEASGFTASSYWDIFDLPEDDDRSPFALFRGTNVASKPCAAVPAATQRSGRVIKGAHGVAATSRARATAIPAPRPPKQPAPPGPSKRRQAIRVVPTPTAGPSKKAPLLSRPATATGRVTSTSRNASASLTSRMPVRPATSASLRPPTVATRNVTVSAKSQTKVTALAMDSDFVLEFDSADVADDDFMFDI
ncbi:hypothetical protein BJV78DRAFT_1219905 [Lactifluus subvellereus]|nr:hypothetical protein BJV78DRAFT_1219905 [Lactifluus subvellereus]